GKTIELKELIDLLGKVIGRKVKIESFVNQAGDVPVTYADITKIRKLLGYNPEVSIEEGIKRFVTWYRREYNL
ncbi:epimerase, partial [candidate division WOR-3 bacterium]|nr:epimerase [candidate division WOR-3 bacterium]